MLPGLQKKEDFSIWLLNTALYIHQAMNRERDNTMKQVIREARQYILEHYQEPELSVEQICRHLHMTSVLPSNSSLPLLTGSISLI